MTVFRLARRSWSGKAKNDLSALSHIQHALHSVGVSILDGVVHNESKQRQACLPRQISRCKITTESRGALPDDSSSNGSPSMNILPPR